MTMGLVISVTDELVAELEALYLAGWEASGEGWNAEYPGDAHETKGFTDLMHKSCAPIIAKLLAERAELLRDAGRYRWLRDRIENKGDMVIARCSEWSIESWSGDDPDTAIDAAMQSEAKP